MLTNLIHDRNTRGQTRLGWLDSFHTFSFGDFYDPSRMGFRSLRAINETQIVPGAGEFQDQFHRNVEILTYVLAGELEHQDDLGNQAVLRPGDAQVLSAGSGIWHKDINPSATHLVRFLQVWIAPQQRDETPRYHQRPRAGGWGQLQLVGSLDGRGNSLVVQQDVNLYGAVLEAGRSLTYAPPSKRFTWIQVLNGVAQLNDEELRAGDGVQIVEALELTIATAIGTEILLFDLS